ncbi:MAG: hypothetical protein GY714_01830 [Desulfobacterales bacterium]|nr:hypothetical protein [Desulfobacterales bacterium]
MLFPNKENPLAYRVQCKLIGLNQYFFYKKYGSKGKALDAAKNCSKSVLERLNAKNLRDELLINILFDGDSIRGLSIINNKRTNHYNLVMRTRVNGKLVLVGERRLKSRNPSYVVEELFMQALWMHEIEMDREIKDLYLVARTKMVDKIIVKCGS